MNSTITRALFGVLWIVSIAAAYFIGQSGTPVPAAPAPVAAGAAASAESDMAGARSGRVVERFAGAVEGDIDTGRPGDIASIVARARMEMSGGMNGMMNLRGMLRAIAPLAELDDSQVQAALAEVEKSVREPQQKMMFYSLLLGQWAETDGPAALAYAEKNLTKGPMDFGIKAAVVGSWARHDPDGVWRWFQEGREKGALDQGSQMTISAVFAGMAAKDLDGAFTRLSTLDEHERNMALNGISSIGGDERSRRRLLERAESLAPEMRQKIHESAIRNWAMMDPEEAIKWIRSRPAEDQAALRKTAGQMVMMADPQKGAELLLEGVEEKDRPRAYDTVIGQWAYRDPRAAAEWLTNQPQGAELDNARRTFSSIVAQRDAPAAMDWAKSIVNEDQRRQSVQQVYTNWQKKDAAAADAALDASGLPAEKITEIREAAKNQPVAELPGGATRF